MDRENRLSNIEKRKLIVFIIVAYGFTFLMGLPLSLAYYLGLNTYPFPNAQMFYPAAGVMLACLVTGRRPGRETPEESGTMPRRFFIFFIALSALTALCCFVPFVRPSEAAMGTSVQSYVIIAGSILAWIFLLTEGKERRAAYGLRWSGTGLSLAMLLLFIALYLGRSFISVTLSGQMGEYLPYWQSPAPYILMAALIPNFFLSFAAFFGEEYGWRYYLQPLLQRRFGLIRGTIILGVIWGLWHLPLDLFYYSPGYALQSIAAHQVTCITLGVFFAFAYMSTGNIWVPVILHFVNNNLAVVVSGTTQITGYAIGWLDILVSLALNGLIFLPFLAAKVFRSAQTGEAGEPEAELNSRESKSPGG